MRDLQGRWSTPVQAVKVQVDRTLTQQARDYAPAPNVPAPEPQKGVEDGRVR